MGMGTSVSTAVSERTAVIIEDYMFDASTAGELQPEASQSDFHDTWDLDGTDFTPELSPNDEGYWDDFSELIANGIFDNATGWTKSSTSSATQELVAGGLKMYSGTSDDNSNSMSSTSASGSQGNVYRLNITASNFVNGSLGYIRLDGVYSAANIIQFEAGTQSVYFTAYRDFTSIQFFAGSHSAYYTIDDVSLVEYAITPLDV